MSDPVVFHFVLARDGSDPRKGERLGTLAIEPAQLAQLSRSARIRGIEQYRRQWQNAIRAAGYRDGWTVQVIRERGYIRSVFPGAAVRPAAGAPIITPTLATPR